MNDGPAPLVSMRGIDKTFFGVHANRGVDFDLYPGEVHSLLGENGAGKTTLMNVLSGIYAPDGGTLEVQGVPVAFRSPRDAIARALDLAESTVKIHIQNIFKKLNLTSRVQAAVYAVENGFGQGD